MHLISRPNHKHSAVNTEIQISDAVVCWLDGWSKKVFRLSKFDRAIGTLIRSLKRVLNAGEVHPATAALLRDLKDRGHVEGHAGCGWENSVTHRKLILGERS